MRSVLTPPAQPRSLESSWSRLRSYRISLWWGKLFVADVKARERRHEQLESVETNARSMARRATAFSRKTPHQAPYHAESVNSIKHACRSLWHRTLQWIPVISSFVARQGHFQTSAERLRYQVSCHAAMAHGRIMMPHHAGGHGDG
ncbi:hypothetical protein AC578_1226 [Pseudocercospora eumusae]|uniref:Uncharacterized protein n=1 Tax=Pseudocercospora eumusae TaxID=321146 RepID=A0A139HCS6_9PEZI|nr:hypothetical protein AC578_1226 [Pseudocercospora eumusae]